VEISTTWRSAQQIPSKPASRP